MIILLALVSWWLELRSWLTRPREVTCPPGWYVNGAPPSGITQCIAVPPPDDDCYRDNPCTGDGELLTLPVRVWCEEGEMPVVIDERHAGCRRGVRA